MDSTVIELLVISSVDFEIAVESEKIVEGFVKIVVDLSLFRD